MAARAAERTAQRKAAEAAAEEAARQALLAAGLDPDMPEGHQAHHWHIPAGANYMVCSCGESNFDGCWSIAADGRWWSDDPAERAQVEREEADWRAWISCRICGEQGVTAADVSWPPRTIGASPSPPP